jgi:hypothetical protein
MNIFGAGPERVNDDRPYTEIIIPQTRSIIKKLNNFKTLVSYVT